MLHSRTFWRLFGASAFLVLTSISLLGVVIVRRVERHFLEQTEETLRTRAVLLLDTVSDRSSEPATLLQVRIRRLGAMTGTRMTLLADDGRVLADSEEDPERMENHANRPEIIAARSDGVGSSVRFSATLEQSMMYVAQRAQNTGSGVAFVRVALPLANVQDQLAGYVRIVWTAALLTAGVALVLAFWLARRISQPIQELTAGAERIAAGSYGHKVYALGKEELAVLGRAFNHMSERLEEQFAQLIEDRQQLRMILGGMVEGVVALDGQQRIVFANERAASLLGFSNKGVVGRGLWEVARRSGLQEVVQRALAAPEPLKEELRWSGPATRSLTVHAARLPGSPPRGAVLVLHDTSELRRLERVRQDFVANVSHELKTPLSVIKACVETLIAGAVAEPEHRAVFLQQIHDQAERLHALILDLLSLARIEAGTEAFEFKSVSLAPIATACAERHRARAESKKQLLETGPAPDGQEIAAWADEEAIDQILENLVDNALKYTPESGRINVRWRGDGDQVCLEVEDSGIGIPEADLPRVFERFYRVDKARSRELGGTGLGLAIVKHLVQAMHGSVQATSRIGQGTTFIVRLPRGPVA
jgi:two-component system phosphate regulon sensor histidine kinase PhoR